MLWKQLALATTAVGFLLPNVPNDVVPEVAPPEEGTFRILPVTTGSFGLPTIALEQSVDVPCAQCKGKNSNLKFDFAVEQGTRLTCNGFELYPNADPWHGDLVAPLVKSQKKGHGKHSKAQRLGYSLSVKAQAMDEEQDLEILSVDLRVIEVGNRFVDGIPSVIVNLIRNPTGEILIGNIDVAGSESSAKCETVWCQTKGLIDDAFRKVKGCGGRHKHAGHKGTAHPAHPAEPATHYDQPSLGQDDYDWGKLLENVVAHIIFPVLMGITAGVAVATVAMVVAAVFVRLAALFKRKQSWAEQRRSTKETGTLDEKVSLVEEADLYPTDDTTAN